jgi:hypothetical protein
MTVEVERLKAIISGLLAGLNGAIGASDFNYWIVEARAALGITGDQP